MWWCNVCYTASLWKQVCQGISMTHTDNTASVWRDDSYLLTKYPKKQPWLHGQYISLQEDACRTEARKVSTQHCKPLLWKTLRNPQTMGGSALESEIWPFPLRQTSGVKSILFFYVVRCCRCNFAVPGAKLTVGHEKKDRNPDCNYLSWIFQNITHHQNRFQGGKYECSLIFQT